jgi:hypothetical protein
MGVGGRGQAVMGISLVFHADTRITVTSSDDRLEAKLAEGFTSLFARRYLPVVGVEKTGNENGSSSAVVEWLPGEKFRVLSYTLGPRDVYRAQGEKPEPYKNEAPVFFMLQVVARAYTKNGLILFTDSVAIKDTSTGRTLLLLGYPHGGKSTIAALALARGLEVLSTENTVVKVEEDGAMTVLGGTRVLVYDPRIVKKYGQAPLHRPREVTKHGYLVVDIDDTHKPSLGKVDSIYVLHCSLSSTGASLEPVSGRKIVKTLWHFATAQIRGDDYYEPAPLNLSDNHTDQKISTNLQRIAKKYKHRFYEAYGAHNTVLDKILENHS